MSSLLKLFIELNVGDLKKYVGGMLVSSAQ